tara:strand:+ start:265 stop:441 length:177 start_codon:yes stop_codon:yes gene_type:complete
MKFSALYKWIISKEVFKIWYFKKGLVLIDLFIIVALLQYFIFDGSFNNMLQWIKMLLQ